MPSYSIKIRREKAAGNTGPGPGNYSMTFEPGRSAQFPNAKRKDFSKTLAPGPGTYNGTSSMGELPSFSFA